MPPSSGQDPRSPDGTRPVTTSISAQDQQLGRSAARGATWVMLGFGGSQLIRLGGNLILTRLLFQEAFGIMALLSSVLTGIQLFSDIGIRASLIQNERVDDEFVDTAWTMQTLRGLGIWLVACALSFPVAHAYGEPQLAWLLPVLSISALVSGFGSTKLFTLNRKLQVGRIELTMILAQLAGLVTMVTWALISPSVFALVAGALVTSSIRMALSHTMLPGRRNRFRWDRRAVRELYLFGRWMFISTVFTFLAQHADRLIFGKMISLELLGVYYIGTVIAILPSSVLGRLSSQIIFPVYSRVRNHPAELRRVFERARAPLLLVSGWAFSGLIAGGPSAIDVLYDDRYLMAGWVVQLLAIGGFSMSIGETYGAALLATGRPQWMSASHLAKVVAMVALLPLGFYLGELWQEGGGFPGAVLGYSASELMRYLTAAVYCRRIGLSGWRSDLRAAAQVVAIGSLGAFAEVAMANAGIHPLVRGLVIAVGVTLLWLPSGYPVARAWLDQHRANA
jgi:O-antigen/teichoic acid export membrane protein